MDDTEIVENYVKEAYRLYIKLLPTFEYMQPGTELIGHIAMMLQQEYFDRQRICNE